MATGTASANWREIDNIDPHGTDYQCERTALLLGDISDLELVSYEQPSIKSLPLSRLLTAIKERIRWLSRKLSDLETEAQTITHNIARSKLYMGDLTDDELANNIIIYGNVGKYTARYLLAARDRIKWLNSLLASN
ncbi:hypothetical protein [Photobacterium leiognathi]|uniref:hypothetical protein n=1 Tax=Photobacterium leiognathi TaxID=553611 RepID=UPI002982900D|nr:hypothetical protein [Photobacterium leiognathi]